jgi:hypothetical protein
MKKFHLLLIEKNIVFLLLLFVQIVVSKEDYHGEMKENYIKENVILQAKVLYQCIQKIKKI